MMQSLPVQMHPRYSEFLEFVGVIKTDARKNNNALNLAFDVWLELNETREWFDARPQPCQFEKFKHGDRVKKKSGSEWQGIVCGWYSTELTPEGYAVESESHKGSVQIYPVSALELVVQDDES